MQTGSQPCIFQCVYVCVHRVHRCVCFFRWWVRGKHTSNFPLLWGSTKDGHMHTHMHFYATLNCLRKQRKLRFFSNKDNNISTLSLHLPHLPHLTWFVSCLDVASCTLHCKQWMLRITVSIWQLCRRLHIACGYVDILQRECGFSCSFMKRIVRLGMLIA